MSDLLNEVARFQMWASTYPPEERHGDWESDYDDWRDLWNAVVHFVDEKPLESWRPEEMDAVLYAIGRDNESQYLAEELSARHADSVLPLARAAVSLGDSDAAWQLAEQLGSLAPDGAEEVLMLLVRNDDEYVRRRALESLARVGSHRVEQEVLIAWERPDVNQEWTRMMCLWCLRHVDSHLLEGLLQQAVEDHRDYLREYAQRMRHDVVE